MSIINIIVVYRNDLRAFERLLNSIKRQNISNVKITVIGKQKEFELLKSVYPFSVATPLFGIKAAVNKAIKNTECSKFMIITESLVFSPEFCRNIDKPGAFTLMNMSVSNAAGSFDKLYSAENAWKSFYASPELACCVFDTENVKRNGIRLKSLTAEGKKAFAEECIKHSDSPTFINDIFIYSESGISEDKI